MWRSPNKSRKDEGFKLTLHLPFNAMTVGHPRWTEVQGPSSVKISGMLQIDNPNKVGSRTYRGARIILRSCSTLSLGPGREDETDIFAEHVIVHPSQWDRERAGPEEPIKPDPDEPLGLMGWSERFPISLPPTDDSVKGRQINHYIIWQHVGQEQDETPRPPHLSTAELDNLNHLTPSLLHPHHTPLQRTLTAISRVNIVHDPNPVNTPNILDEHFQVSGQDIGPVKVHCIATPFTVAGPVTVEVEASRPSPKVTIFAFTAFVQQNEKVTSPRDGKTVASDKMVPFINVGRSPKSLYPQSTETALWRGTLAGGTDSKAWSISQNGRFPHSCDTRASTLSNTSTPLTITHCIVYRILFSVHGEMADGTKCAGDGQLRHMRISRKVVFPSCRLAYMNSLVPSYESHESSTDPFSMKPHMARYYQNRPCSACKQKPLDNICDSCPSRTIAHVRHDSEWPCSSCQKSYCLPKGDPDHVSIGLCACTDWMEWKLSANGRDQIAAAAVVGNLEGIEVQQDQNLAIKLQAEEDSRQFGKRAT